MVLDQVYFTFTEQQLEDMLSNLRAGGVSQIKLAVVVEVLQR